MGRALGHRGVFQSCQILEWDLLKHAEQCCWMIFLWPFERYFSHIQMMVSMVRWQLNGNCVQWNPFYLVKNAATGGNQTHSLHHHKPVLYQRFTRYMYQHNSHTLLTSSKFSQIDRALSSRWAWARTGLKLFCLVTVLVFLAILECLLSETSCDQYKSVSSVLIIQRVWVYINTNDESHCQMT